ncbi:MAG: NAD-dependent epimerase/dehydratase family protein [Chitinivibrionales bacterium]|nr:NAD-dependent epimerase/dehydratase family protein [Chitinivibrionales bacterium]MBD3355587.1 NAD-dependent epimerase/dehydratase family protein [Chitinivibrionales bacterium]
MKVLLTGSRGYIGSVLAAMLTSRGHEVKGLDCDLYRRCTFIGCVPAVPTALKDVRDTEVEDVWDADAVIHLAALSNDPLGDYRPELTREINACASIRLAEIAKKAGVRRFLYASSCSVYGAAGDRLIDETAALNPVTPYGLSKAEVERELRGMADDSFTPTYMRPATAYGVSPRLRFDLVANNLTAWAYTTSRVYLKSDGSAWRPIAHVEDIARAFTAVLEAPRRLVHNQSFNVGNSADNYRIRRIAEMVEETVPGSRVEYANDADTDTRNYRVNCAKIARMLPEAAPHWNARKGIRQLYEIYGTTGLTLEAFEGPQFKRIAHVLGLIREGFLDENLRWKI